MPSSRSTNPERAVCACLRFTKWRDCVRLPRSKSLMSSSEGNRKPCWCDLEQRREPTAGSNRGMWSCFAEASTLMCMRARSAPALSALLGMCTEVQLGTDLCWSLREKYTFPISGCPQSSWALVTQPPKQVCPKHWVPFCSSQNRVKQHPLCSRIITQKSQLSGVEMSQSVVLYIFT